MYNRQKRRHILLESSKICSKRRRGVVLTTQALDKLQSAKRETETRENGGTCYTLESLSDRTGLDSHTLVKVFTSNTKVDRRTLSRCFKAFDLCLETGDYYQPATTINKSEQETKDHPEVSQNWQEWHGAPDVSFFSGRVTELATLNHSIESERCRLIVLWGIEGIGKTWLATKLAKSVEDRFDIVLWRSLRNATSVEEALADLIQLLSPMHSTELPKTLDSRILLLISYLRACRCLLILDGSETIFQGNLRRAETSSHLLDEEHQNHEDYARFLSKLGDTSHQSCILITSQEKPKGIERLEGHRSPVRIMKLKGLQTQEAKQILKEKGVFKGSKQDYSQLIEYYRGNPLMLQIVSTTIQNLFAGNIREFLNQKAPIFGDICVLLDRQFARLSNAEKKLLCCLANQEKPMSVAELRLQIKSQMSAKVILEVLESLLARSLLEQKNGNFSLEPMLRDYVTM